MHLICYSFNKAFHHSPTGRSLACPSRLFYGKNKDGNLEKVLPARDGRHVIHLEVRPTRTGHDTQYGHFCPGGTIRTYYAGNPGDEGNASNRAVKVEDGRPSSWGCCNDSSKPNINVVHPVYQDWYFLPGHQHLHEAHDGGWMVGSLEGERSNALLVTEYVCGYSDLSDLLEGETLPTLLVFLGTAVAIAQKGLVADRAGIGVDSATALGALNVGVRVMPADGLVPPVVERLAPERYVMQTSAKLQPQSTTQSVVARENAKGRGTVSRERAESGLGTVSNQHTEGKQCSPCKKINEPAMVMDRTFCCSTRPHGNDHT